MHREATTLGKTIIEREAELDARFARAEIDEVSLQAAITEIGRLRGELRLSHLRAHLQMRALLSEDQIARYDELRGYVRR